MTSLRRLVGAQPRPSIEFLRNSDRQMSPSSLMLGCHSLVWHFTTGGCNDLLLFTWRNISCGGTRSGSNDRGIGSEMSRKCGH